MVVRICLDLREISIGSASASEPWAHLHVIWRPGVSKLLFKTGLRSSSLLCADSWSIKGHRLSNCLMYVGHKRNETILWHIILASYTSMPFHYKPSIRLAVTTRSSKANERWWVRSWCVWWAISPFLTVCWPLSTGWYDSVYDEELGSQPCIFTSVTPVSFFFFWLMTVSSNICFDAGLEQRQSHTFGRKNKISPGFVRGNTCISWYFYLQNLVVMCARPLLVHCH